MIQQSGVLLPALKNLLIIEIFIPRWRIAPSTASSMATPFQSTVPHVIKIEDEGNGAPYSQGLSEQELMDIFRNGVRRRLELGKKQDQYNTSGSANPPPIQLLPPPLPPPHPPSPPPAPTCAKRLPAGPPPGLAGVRQPPQKQYQRKPPWQRVQQSPQATQNAHRTPGPSARPPVNMQAAQHTQNPHCSGGLLPSPPPVNMQVAQHTQNPHCSGGPPPVNASSLVPPRGGASPFWWCHRTPMDLAPPLVPPASSSRLPPVQRSSSGNPPHPASKKKPAVACGVCGVLCMSMWHLRDHEQGRKHRNKVACLAGEMNVWCQLCDVHLSGARNVEQHYAGKQHLWRLNGAA